MFLQTFLLTWQHFINSEQTVQLRQTVKAQLQFLLAGCILSQQHSAVSLGWICSDKWTCWHIETEVANQTCHAIPVTVYWHQANQSGQPVPAPTLLRQAPGKAASAVPFFKSQVWLHLEKGPQGKQNSNQGLPLWGRYLTTSPTRWSELQAPMIITCFPALEEASTMISHCQIKIELKTNSVEASMRASVYSSFLAIDNRAGQIFSLVDATNPSVWYRSSVQPHSLAARSATCGHVSWHLSVYIGQDWRMWSGVWSARPHTHTGKCLKCQSSSDGHSNHSALCAGRR